MYMPFCVNCGKENKVTAKFCTACGKAIPQQLVISGTEKVRAIPEIGSKRNLNNLVIKSIIGSVISLLTVLIFWQFTKGCNKSNNNAQTVTAPVINDTLPPSLPAINPNTKTVKDVNIDTQKVSDLKVIDTASKAEAKGVKTISINFEPGSYIVNGHESRPVFFHNAPDPSTKRKAYFSTQELVYVEKIKNGFGYIEFTNTSGKKSYGWVDVKYLIVKPE